MAALLSTVRPVLLRYGADREAGRFFCGLEKTPAVRKQKPTER